MTGSLARTGLTEAEAAARLASDGPNELPRVGARSHLRIIIDVLKEPMLALLLGAASSTSRSATLARRSCCSALPACPSSSRWRRRPGPNTRWKRCAT